MPPSFSLYGNPPIILSEYSQATRDILVKNCGMPLSVDFFIQCHGISPLDYALAFSQNAYVVPLPTRKR
jgi:hypothetical protein